MGKSWPKMTRSYLLSTWAAKNLVLVQGKNPGKLGRRLWYGPVEEVHDEHEGKLSFRSEKETEEDTQGNHKLC